MKNKFFPKLFDKKKRVISNSQRLYKILYTKSIQIMNG